MSILSSSRSDKKCAVNINDMHTFLKYTDENKESFVEENHEGFFRCYTQICDNFLNFEIYNDEVMPAVKKLKHNKAAGNDKVLNEHVCSTIAIFLPVYQKLFNVIFESDIVLDK